MADHTPIPDPTPTPAARYTEEEWEARRMASYVDELRAEQAAAVPRWGVELGELVRGTNLAVQQLAASVRTMQQQIADVAAAVKGRNGVEDQLDRHKEVTAREQSAQDARLAALEQWVKDRDRADTVRISEAQRGWWDSALKLVGATLVGLALGGGAVGVALARGCEPAPVVKTSSP